VGSKTVPALFKPAGFFLNDSNVLSSNSSSSTWLAALVTPTCGSIEDTNTKALLASSSEETSGLLLFIARNAA
jgi:hypothetical protein